jgi:hypothetical protein
LGEDILRVGSLKREVEYSIRDPLRRRLLAQGAAAEYQDREVFRSVDGLLSKVFDSPESYALLPEFLGDEAEWQLQPELKFWSHRTVMRPLVLFIKRRVLLPLTRWLYEYSADNFRRQDRLNKALVACVEELAIENARLRRDLTRLGEPSRK